MDSAKPIRSAPAGRMRSTNKLRRSAHEPYRCHRFNVRTRSVLIGRLRCILVNTHAPLRHEKFMAVPFKAEKHKTRLESKASGLLPCPDDGSAQHQPGAIPP